MRGEVEPLEEIVVPALSRENGRELLRHEVVGTTVRLSTVELRQTVVSRWNESDEP